MLHERNLTPAACPAPAADDDMPALPIWWHPWPEGHGERPVTTDTAAWVARTHARFPTRPGVRRVAEALAGQIPDGAGVVSIHGVKSSAHVSRQVIAEAMASLQRAGLLEVRSGIPVDGRDVRLIGA